MAGRGGLNLTHSEALPEFLTRYGAAAPHLTAAIDAFPPAGLREWSEALGDATFVGSPRRGVPKSVQGLAIAARMVATAGFHGRAIRAAPPLDRLGQRWASVVSDARGKTGC